MSIKAGLALFEVGHMARNVNRRQNRQEFLTPISCDRLNVEIALFC